MESYRFYSDGTVFFVTFSIVEWLPVFVSDKACKIISDSLNFCHSSKGLRINAYVIMPTHFHGIFFHESFAVDRLGSVVTDFRKNRRRPASSTKHRSRTSRRLLTSPFPACINQSAIAVHENLRILSYSSNEL